MSEGWITLNREISKHWVFKDAEYFRAWVTILMEVNHSENKILIGKTLFTCSRGESLHSLESWGEIFGNWGKSKTKRFFDLLKDESMIELKNERLTTRLTVCNYNRYQDFRNADETQVKRKRNADETQVKQERATNNNELTMINNENNCLPDESVSKKMNLEERREAFKASIREHKKEEYSSDMLHKFFNHFAEEDSKGKMRFEKEKTWNLSMRLSKWYLNRDNFSRTATRTGDNRENVELLTTAKMYS
jgi:hypothetical protein